MFSAISFDCWFDHVSDVNKGGETEFVNLGFRVSPQAGTAMMWYNTESNGQPDFRLKHAGLPPSTGMKYVVNCFFNKLRQNTLEEDIKTVVKDTMGNAPCGTPKLMGRSLANSISLNVSSHTAINTESEAQLEVEEPVVNQSSIHVMPEAQICATAGLPSSYNGQIYKCCTHNNLQVQNRSLNGMSHDNSNRVRHSVPFCDNDCLIQASHNEFAARNGVTRSQLAAAAKSKS